MIAFILFELSISEKKKPQNFGNRFSDLKSKNFYGLTLGPHIQQYKGRLFDKFAMFINVLEMSIFETFVKFLLHRHQRETKMHSL